MSGRFALPYVRLVLLREREATNCTRGHFQEICPDYSLRSSYSVHGESRLTFAVNDDVLMTSSFVLVGEHASFGGID